jgi:CO dehydrogenase maturation factor
MDIHIENAELILNRMNGAVPAALQQRIDDMDLPLLGVIPADTELMEFEFSGRPLVELGDDSPVFAAVSEMMQKIVAH